MSGPLDESLWREVERRLDRAVSEPVRDQVRAMPASPVTQWLKSRTDGEREQALGLLVWHLKGVFELLDSGLSSVKPAAPEPREDLLEDLGPLPDRWEDSYVVLVSEGWTTQILTGKSRAVRSSLYKVLPVPDKWKVHSRGVLRAHEKLQRQALWRVRRIGVNKWADMSFAGHPPPPPLEPSDFVPEEELDALLDRMRESGNEAGEFEHIWWPDSERPGARKDVEFGIDLRPECARQWMGNYNPLYDIKSRCQELRFHTGLPEEDAVRFLLCDSDVCLPWLTFTIQLDNAPRGGHFKFDIGSPLVPVGMVEHWYRLAREYVFAQQNDPEAYTAGGETFPSDFAQWLNLIDSNQPRPERSERALLVEFVSERREDGVPWPEILADWNRFRPAAVYASVESLKAVYRRAKRRDS